MVALSWASQTMKTHSFFMYKLRTNTFEMKTGYLTFLFCPTLVYSKLLAEGKHKTKEPISYLRAAKELLACIETFLLVNIIHVRWVFPILQDETSLFQAFLEGIIPCHLCFLLIVYGFWHCYMNLLAEITQWADRSSFYGNWWYTLLVKQYFQNWSAPVHEWLLYHGMLDSWHFFSLPKSLSRITTLLISSFFHEMILWLVIKQWCVPWMSINLVVIGMILFLEEGGFYFPQGASILFNLIGHSGFYLMMSRGCLFQCSLIH